MKRIKVVRLQINKDTAVDYPPEDEQKLADALWGVPMSAAYEDLTPEQRPYLKQFEADEGLAF